MFTLKLQSCSCGAKPDELHKLGCDVERCLHCGGQFISCDFYGCKHGVATYTDGHDRLPWTGEWPGNAECREFNLWCYGPPWTPCNRDHPKATEDLNRLREVAEWSPDKRRWILKPKTKHL